MASPLAPPTRLILARVLAPRAIEIGAVQSATTGAASRRFVRAFSATTCHCPPHGDERDDAGRRRASRSGPARGRSPPPAAAVGRKFARRDGTRLGNRLLSTSTGGGKGDGAGDGRDEDGASRAQSDHAHCVDLVRTRDYEGYLCGLLLPPPARDSYFALRAFNVEVASVKDGGGLASTRSRRVPGHFGDDSGEGVDSSLASRLRMQWWRDAVAEMYETDDDDGAAPGPSPAGFLSSTFAATRGRNPVVRELRRAVRSSGLTRRFLERLVDARESDLDVRQPDGLADLVRYGEDAHSSLLYLALECADVRNDGADEVASHVGVGLGVVTALRSAVVRAATGEVALPAEVMERHGASREYLMNPPQRDRGEELSPEEMAADEALRKAVREVAHVAGAHLMAARGMQSAVPKEGRAALLPAVGALSYLKALEGAGFDLLHPDLMAKEGLPARLERLRVSFSLGRAWLTGVF